MVNSSFGLFTLNVRADQKDNFKMLVLIKKICDNFV
jgi:hypothetical protein